MSRTNFDFVFQVTGPAADRTPTAPGRSGDSRPAFGDHLSQASATTPEPTKTAERDGSAEYRPSGNRRATSEAAPNGDRPTGASASGGAPAHDAAHEANQEHDSHSHDKPRSTSDTSAADTSDAAASAKELDGATDDANESTEEDAGELANVAESVSVGGANQFVAASVLAVEAAAEIADAAVPTGTAKPHQTADAPLDDDLPTAKAPAARTAVKVAAENVAIDLFEPNSDTLDESNSVGEIVNPTTTLKAGKHSDAVRTSRPGATNEQHVKPHGQTERRGTATFASEEASANVEAIATEKANTNANEAAAADYPADETDQSSGDSRRSSTARSASKLPSRPDGAVVTSQTAMIALANGAATQTGDTTTNGEAADDASLVAKTVAPKGDALAAAPSRLHANSGAIHRGGRRDGADDLPRIDATRFVGRVARAFQTAHERGGTLQLRLSPPELGSLRLELSVKDGVMMAALETETAAARRVLLDHLPALRDRLADQNIRVERFDVDVRRDGGGQPDDRASQWQQQHQREPNQPASRRQSIVPPRVAEAVPNDGLLIEPQINSTGINLFA